MKPMLAGKASNDLIHEMLGTGPLLVSFKLDGVRGLVLRGQLVSRSLKPIRNKHVQSLFGRAELEGLDGELIFGEPGADDVYRKTNSAVMSIEGEPSVKFHIFDDFSDPGLPTYMRLERAQQRAQEHCTRVVQYTARTVDEVLDLERTAIELGYEGLMLRTINTPYKFGRSTTREGYLLKLKRFEDSEALVIDVIEEMHNGNIGEVNELGNTARSTARAGLTGKGTMGALRVRDTVTGQEFKIGTGFTQEQRKRIWQAPVEGLIVKYKYFSVGVKDLPRHPVFIGWRDIEDM